MRDLVSIEQEIRGHYTDSYGYMDHCKRDPGDGPASGNGKLYTALLSCAEIYYGSTPWFELFEHLAAKEGY